MKNQIKSYSIIVFIAILLTLLLTACGGGDSDSDANATDTTDTTDVEATSETVEGADFELAEQAAEDIALDVPNADELYAEALTSTDGEELYVTFCSKCHGLEGYGDGPSVGSLHIEGSFVLTALAERPDEELTEIITYGKAVDMPAWGLILSDEQIEAVLAYVRTLGAE